MSRLAQECGAINLSQGFPDFDPPRRLVELVAQKMREGVNQYAPMAGWPPLQQAIVAKVEALYGRRVSPESEVTVTSGRLKRCSARSMPWCGRATRLYCSSRLMTRTSRGRARGGRTVRVPLERPGFGVDWQRLRNAMTQRTRLLIGELAAQSDRRGLLQCRPRRTCDVLRGGPALVLSDEVYEHIVFGGQKHSSLLTRPELAERSFVVSSFGKTLHCTGWKIGYCVAPPALTAEFRKVHQFVQFAVATPLQAGLADFLVECPGQALELAGFYERKRDHFCRCSSARRSPSFGCRTYFQLADYSGLSDLPDVEFARWLTREVGVAAIPVRYFPPVLPASDSCDSASPRARPRSMRRASACQAFRLPEQSMSSHLRVTLVQTELAWQDPAANRRSLAGHFADWPGTRISSSCPRCSRPASAWRPSSWPRRWWADDRLAARGGCGPRCVITGSLIVRDAGRCFNRLVWARPDGSLEYYDKRHLFRLANEQQHYAAGTRRLVAAVKGWRVCR